MSGIIKGIGSVAGKVGPLAAGLIGGPAAPFIGAGLGALGGLLGRGKEDPRYQAQTGYLDQMKGFGPPQTASIDPLSQQAFGLFQNLATQGPDITKFKNLFEGDVVEGIKRDTGDARTTALNAANDASTRAEAFGGSRSGIMAATALGDVNKAGLRNLADFRYAGYGDAMKNAMAQQQFGLQAAGALAGAGDYSRSVTQAGYDAPFNRFAALGPLTAQQLIAGQGYQQRPSALQSALGGALTGFGLFKKKPADANGPANALSGWLSNWGKTLPTFAPAGMK